MSMTEPDAASRHADLPSFRVDWGLQGLLRLIDSYQFTSVLDVGSGGGDTARLLRHLGKEVVTIDLNRDADIDGDFITTDIGRHFDAVWCSHVLEHQRNVGLFLDKLRSCLTPDGALAISVPLHPAERMVAGHLTNWNPWLLCYNLVLAGFDCADARYVTTVDLSLIVTNRPSRQREAERIAGDGADLSTDAQNDPLAPLAPYFPFPIRHGNTADAVEWNWGSLDYRIPASVSPFRLLSRFLPAEGLVIGQPGTA